MDLAWPQTATACSYMLHSTIQKSCFEAPFKFQNFIVNFFCMVFLRILTCDAALHHQAVLHPPPLQGSPPVQPHLEQSVQVDKNSFISYGSQSIIPLPSVINHDNFCYIAQLADHKINFSGPWQKHKKPLKTQQGVENYQSPAQPESREKTNASPVAHGRGTLSLKRNLRQTFHIMGHIGSSAVSRIRTPSPNSTILPWSQRTWIAWAVVSTSSVKGSHCWQNSNKNAARSDLTVRCQPTWVRDLTLWNRTTPW